MTDTSNEAIQAQIIYAETFIENRCADLGVPAQASLTADTFRAMLAERDALKGSNAALIQERESLIETKREQIHRMTGERNKARQEVFALKVKIAELEKPNDA